MVSTIHAIYENGVFRPLERVDCREHAKVIVTIPLPEEHVSPPKHGFLDAIIDIAENCADSDLATQHDKYLYGKLAG